MNRKAKEVAEEQLREIVRRHHTVLHDDNNLIEFAPGDVAERAYDELDPKLHAPILVQSAAYFELSMLADNIRKRKRKAVPEQEKMFEGLSKPLHRQAARPRA